MESQYLNRSEQDEGSGELFVINSVSDIVWTAFGSAAVIMTIVFLITCIRILILGQKTRSPQQRRMYVGTRARPSLGSHEPTIYVSPSNLPPPPKYECMAPPSYEEVVGIHYPNYQVQQPIAQPIANALAQASQSSTTAQANDTRPNDTPTRTNDEATVVTTVNERPAVTSASS